jgi:hypothetical protein
MIFTTTFLRSLPGIREDKVNDLEKLVGTEPIEFQEAAQRYIERYPDRIGEVARFAVSLCLFHNLSASSLWNTDAATQQHIDICWNALKAVADSER